MIKQLQKVGDSTALMLDNAILEILGLAENGYVQLTIQGSTLIVAPTFPGIIVQETLNEKLNLVIKTRHDALKRLAK